VQSSAVWFSDVAVIEMYVDLNYKTSIHHL
jgi:hypothetical protein